MSSNFCYVQLNTQNHPKAQEFYSKLFGWKMANDNPYYTEVDTGGAIGAGMMPTSSQGVPSHWLPYVEVQDLTDTLKKAKSLGAKVIVEPTDVPNKGRFGIFADPTGAMLAVWVSQAKK